MSDLNDLRTIGTIGAADTDATRCNMLHAYATNDTLATVAAANYFNAFSGVLSTGDIVLVSADIDGTPAINAYVASKDASDNITTTGFSTITQTFNERLAMTVDLAALGTAETRYLVCPIAGAVARVDAVSDGANATAASTVTVTVDGADIASLEFADGYTAGTAISEASPADKTLSAGDVITVATDGSGDGSGRTAVTIFIEP